MRSLADRRRLIGFIRSNDFLAVGFVFVCDDTEGLFHAIDNTITITRLDFVNTKIRGDDGGQLLVVAMEKQAADGVVLFSIDEAANRLDAHVVDQEERLLPVPHRPLGFLEMLKNVLCVAESARALEEAVDDAEHGGFSISHRAHEKEAALLGREQPPRNAVNFVVSVFIVDKNLTTVFNLQLIQGQKPAPCIFFAFQRERKSGRTVDESRLIHVPEAGNDFINAFFHIQTSIKN